MLYACRLGETASVSVQSWLGNSEVCDPVLYAFVVQEMFLEALVFQPLWCPKRVWLGRISGALHHAAYRIPHFRDQLPRLDRQFLRARSMLMVCERKCSECKVSDS
jgi:hypothetical protein